MTTAKPTISVIVPVYNAEAFLPACVEGILAQTYGNFELIFIDDGSSDGSGALCDGYAARDARVKVVHQANAGVAAARNRGLSLAAGDYVTFVDADDWVDATLLEHLASAVMSDDVDVAVSGLAWHFPDGQVDEQKFDRAQSAKTPREVGAIILQLESRGLIHGPYQKLIRRALIEADAIRFPPLSFGEDALFNLTYLANIKSIAVAPYVDYHYRRNAGSLSIGVQRRYEDLMALLHGRRQGFAALKQNFGLDDSAVGDVIAPTCMLNHMTALYAAYSPRHLLPKHQRLVALRAFKRSDDFRHFTTVYRPGDMRNRLFKWVVTALPAHAADAALRGMLWAKYRRPAARRVP